MIPRVQTLGCHQTNDWCQSIACRWCLSHILFVILSNFACSFAMTCVSFIWAVRKRLLEVRNDGTILDVLLTGACMIIVSGLMWSAVHATKQLALRAVAKRSGQETIVLLLVHRRMQVHISTLSEKRRSKRIESWQMRTFFVEMKRLLA